MQHILLRQVIYPYQRETWFRQKINIYKYFHCGKEKGLYLIWMALHARSCLQPWDFGILIPLQCSIKITTNLIHELKHTPWNGCWKHSIEDGLNCLNLITCYCIIKTNKEVKQCVIGISFVNIKGLIIDNLYIKITYCWGKWNKTKQYFLLYLYIMHNPLHPQFSWIKYPITQYLIHLLAVIRQFPTWNRHI